MKVLYGINQVPGTAFKKPVLAVGIFDGLHRGHQHLISQAVRRAGAIGGTPIVMTFFPHPIQVLRPDLSLPLLVPLKYRLQLIASLGVKVCLVVRFTKRFSHLSPDQFIKRYLIEKLKVREIFVGDDFRFGQNRSGSLEFFKEAAREHGFVVNVVKAVRKNSDVISSTRIRKYVAQGQLHKARRLLGRHVSVIGRVIRGDARGKRLGYPTANIRSFSDVVPPSGVYLAQVIFDGKVYPGMANVGQRPSFFPDSGRTHIEVHILDFRKNIYGKEIRIEFIKKLREEKRFPTEKALIDQLQKDEKKARALFAHK